MRLFDFCCMFDEEMEEKLRSNQINKDRQSCHEETDEDQIE